MLTKIPFRINRPLEVLHPTRRINFEDKEVRKELFERNIYYYSFGNRRNPILEGKYKTFLDVGTVVLDYLQTHYPDLKVLNLSLFGSSLVLENPGDYDFLAITQGDVFLLDEPCLGVNGREVQVGISIKGIENYTHGFKKKDNSTQSLRLEQIIDRTTISLFRRHLPIFGRDFIKNEEEFLKNALAQVSDLVNNSYELFYLERENEPVSDKKRARKMLTRCYEATSYLGAIDEDKRIQDLRKEIYETLMKEHKLEDSKKIFDRFVALYEEMAKKEK